jgi:hypothetical protein
MAIVSRQEFAEMCGIDPAILRVNIQRKKVIVSGEGGKTIDTDNPINKAFKQKQKAIVVAKKEEKEVIARIPKAQPFKIREADNEDQEDDTPEALTPEAMMALFAGNKGGRRGKGDDEKLGGMEKWILMKIKGDAELVSLKVEREELLLQKTAGKLLPVDLVTEVHRRYATHIFNHFESGVESIAMKFCEIMAGGDKTLYTRALDDCRALLTTCIQKAGKDVDEDIRRLVYEFSDKKRLG